MVRERIMMKKIDNATARQLTFSKRRRGLFKKAEELSVLCNAEIAVVVFSATGKLFEYSSSSSVRNAISRYDLYKNNTGRVNNLPPLHLQPVNSDQINISKGAGDTSSKQRKMREDDIQGLNLEELHKLEKILEVGLSRVLQTKEERIMGEFATLKKEIDQLTEANMQLKKKMALVSQRKHSRVFSQSKDSIAEEGSVNITPPAPPSEATRADTSLKLGPPFSS
ncbi:MADS-box protein AGL24-like [Punica granatum]|uniref:MADS-box protein AGL24-like n=1 Tax=Punica granatum TaxID=22663 RepID=A0A6P8C0F8_PUNGR|nr:MADS-box protein AGL24-like [Punica granatum]XP_031375361.1 MADS-box protein AGL24-like [Punica granatum]XP_031375432.1 MADS-box protein AGL24-like [Punica granatum]XP_031375489.1 MADS-box protein AGL24-like [Punica granatum]